MIDKAETLKKTFSKNAKATAPEEAIVEEPTTEQNAEGKKPE